MIIKFIYSQYIYNIELAKRRPESEQIIYAI